MRTLNVKIPVSILQLMDNYGHLNPDFCNKFINEYIDRPFKVEHIEELTYTYGFKTPLPLHRRVKQEAMEYDISMGHYLGLLFKHYYREATQDE